MSAEPEVLVLRPRRGPTLAWSAAAVLLLTIGGWLVVDSDGALLAWGALVLFSLVSSFFLAQLLLPGWFTIVCDGERCRGRTFGVRVDVPWVEVRAARIIPVAGEPLLELHRYGAARPVAIPLPLGADSAGLHRFLAERLGAGSAR